jgi:hypothetical protein
MTLEPTGENKAKEYFDRFPECYKPSSVSYVPTTTTAFETGLLQAVTFALTDAEQAQIHRIFDDLFNVFNEIDQNISSLTDKQEINNTLLKIFELNRTKLDFYKSRITNYSDLFEKYKKLEKIFNNLFISIITKLLHNINYEFRKGVKTDYLNLFKELNKIYDENIRPIKIKYNFITNVEMYNKFNKIDNNNNTYNVSIINLLQYINELFDQYKISMRRSEIDNLFAIYKQIKSELLTSETKTKYEEFLQKYNKYLEEIKKPIDIYTRGFDEADILLLALIIHNYNQYTINKINFDKYLNIYENIFKKEYLENYTDLKNFFKDSIYDEYEIQHVGWFNKWFLNHIGKIQYINPLKEYRDRYNATQTAYTEQLNLIQSYELNYKELKDKINNFVDILRRITNLKKNIDSMTDQEPLFTMEYVKKLNKIITDIIRKDKYSYILTELNEIRRATQSFKGTKINKDAVITQQLQPAPAFQPLAPVQPAPAFQTLPTPQPSSPKPPAPAMQQVPASQQFRFTPIQQDLARRFIQAARGGKKTKKIRKTKK